MTTSETPPLSVISPTFCVAERGSKSKARGARLREAANINSSLMTLGKCLQTLRANQSRRGPNRVVPYRESKVTRILQDYYEVCLLGVWGGVGHHHRGFTWIASDIFDFDRSVEAMNSTLVHLGPLRSRVDPAPYTRTSTHAHMASQGDGRVVMIVNVNPHSSAYEETSHVLKFSAIAKEVTTKQAVKSRIDTGLTRIKRKERPPKAKAPPGERRAGNGMPAVEELDESLADMDVGPYGQWVLVLLLLLLFVVLVCVVVVAVCGVGVVVVVVV